MSDERGSAGERTSISIRQAVGRTLALAWRSSPRSFIIVGALTVCSALVPPVVVMLSRTVVDLVASAAREPIDAQAIVPAAIALGILGATQRVLSEVQSSRRQVFSWQVNRHAERLFIEQTSRSDLIRFDDPGWHDQVARVSIGLNYRPFNLTYQTIGLAGASVTVVGMLGVLLDLDPMLLVLALASVLIPIPFQRRINRRIYKFHYNVTQQQRAQSYFRWLLSDTRPAKDLRAFVLEKPFLRRHKELSDAYGAEYARLYRSADVVYLLAGLLSGAALAVAYGFVATQGAAGELSAGDVTALIAAVASVTSQVSSISSSLLGIDEHAPFLNELFDFLAVQPSIAVNEAAVLLPDRLTGGVVLDRVTFRYPDRPEAAVEDLSLEVKEGEMLALVGDNGAGKTTLVKLLLRFYDPEEGSITFGGVDLRAADPTVIRDRVGVLFQDYTNFAVSVRDNVAFGRIDRPAGDPEIEEALRAARADVVVKGLPQGLDSMLGRMFEGGKDLSGGEWQRIALARLIFRNADIWILDEPTSSLDPEAEAAIFSELKSQLKGRIGIVISHRFSTVRIADRIAVLDAGRLREVGTHEELMAKRGRYAELFELQASAYR